jgi:hypothetical protein
MHALALHNQAMQHELDVRCAPWAAADVLFEVATLVAASIVFIAPVLLMTAATLSTSDMTLVSLIHPMRIMSV